MGGERLSVSSEQGADTLYLCDDCGAWFVHPNGVAMHARDVASMQFDPSYSGATPGTTHTSFTVYRKVSA